MTNNMSCKWACVFGITGKDKAAFHGGSGEDDWNVIIPSSIKQKTADLSKK
jgi:hypothetical protein